MISGSNIQLGGILDSPALDVPLNGISSSTISISSLINSQSMGGYVNVLWAVWTLVFWVVGRKTQGGLDGGYLVDGH